MTFLKDKAFWDDAIERALWTVAEFIVGVSAIYTPAISISSTGDLKAAVIFVLGTLHWLLLAALGAGLMSVFKSIYKARKEEKLTIKQ